LKKQKSDARSEAENILAQARTSIENEKRSALNEIKNQVADLSIEIASKVLEQELDDNKNHQDYIDKLLKEKKFDK
jgi:F-type H+-transporting ATPase subunit b